MHLVLVVAQLLVEIGPVRAGLHCQREYALHDHVVVLLERFAVGGGERRGELLCGIVVVVSNGLTGECKTSAEKEKEKKAGKSALNNWREEGERGERGGGGGV